MNVADFKKGFFDRAAVMGAVDRGRIKGLSRFGAFVRTAARSSMRRRRKSAEPGSPPSAHEGSLKRLLFFAWDAITRSVVVGPALFRAKAANAQPINATVPEVLEKGGTVTIREVQLSGGLWVRSRGKFANKPRATRTRTLTYKPHGFMNPALTKVAPQFPGFFKDTVR